MEVPELVGVPSRYPGDVSERGRVSGGGRLGGGHLMDLRLGGGCNGKSATTGEIGDATDGDLGDIGGDTPSCDTPGDVRVLVGDLGDVDLVGVSL